MPDSGNILPLLIEVEDLQKAFTDQLSSHLLVVDLCSEDRFLQAHIPGAKHILPSETQAGPPIPGFSPTNDQLIKLMQRIGLTHKSHVIVYDDEGGGWAGRFIWLLDEIGHTNYSYLNGGIHAWAAAGLEIETGKKHYPQSDIHLENTGQNSVTLETLINHVRSGSVQIWDARSPQEYSGEKVNATKGGHIPRALNYEWTNAMDASKQLRLKPLEQILSELKAVGIVPDKDTVTHCQSHHRSGLTYLLGKLLNFKSIKAYPGSWGEWGNRPDTPIE